MILLSNQIEDAAAEGVEVVPACNSGVPAEFGCETPNWMQYAR